MKGKQLPYTRVLACIISRCQTQLGLPCVIPG